MKKIGTKSFCTKKLIHLLDSGLLVWVGSTQTVNLFSIFSHIFEFQNKNILRIFRGSNLKKNKNTEPQLKIQYSYKKVCTFTVRYSCHFDTHPLGNGQKVCEGWRI